MTLKSVILFLFDLKKSSFLGKKIRILPSLRESLLKNIHFYIIPRTRERKFSGAQFPHHRCGIWACRIKRDPPPLKKYDIRVIWVDFYLWISRDILLPFRVSFIETGPDPPKWTGSAEVNRIRTHNTAIHIRISGLHDTIYLHYTSSLFMFKLFFHQWYGFETNYECLNFRR